MTDIKEKISKLLALAESPEPEEAKAALLKARALMVKYKLRPEECQKSEAKVVTETVGVECTKMTDSWAAQLSAVIAKRYCCRSFQRKYKGAKKIMIGFIGLEDDYEICRQIYLYAYGCIKAQCAEIAASHRKDHSRKQVREMCNAYGWGFCFGLDDAYQEQQKEHQEWGLVMAVPDAVQNAAKSLGKPSGYGKSNAEGWRQKYEGSGYKDGKNFNPALYLGENT